MGKTLRKILDVLFWIVLVIVVILILWRILGNSPTDFQVIIPIFVLLLIKIWSNNNAIKEVGYQIRLLAKNTKHSFEKVSDDISGLKVVLLM